MRTTDTATFNSEKFEEDVAKMRARREAVHDAGERVYRETGHMDPLVRVYGSTRRSRNAFVKGEDGKPVLVNGVKIPLFFGTDGTGSFGSRVAMLFKAMPVVDGMLSFLRETYQTDISFGVLQDVDDIHDVFQMPEFESEKFADHMRLLIPDKNGGDYPEDYDLGLYYIAEHTDTDIRRYNRKGYAIVVLDQVGRGNVYSEAVGHHLGHKMQGNSLSTADVCKALLKNWHGFIVNVGSDGENASSEVTRWWQNRIGKNRVVEAEIDLIAEVQVALVYVTETLKPTVEELHKVLSAEGANIKISEAQTRKIWSWLMEAHVPFGEQAKIAGDTALPQKGDVFEHIRHAWPIDHPRASENVTPAEGEEEASASKSHEVKKPINWSKF